MIHMFITGGYGGIGRRARFRFWWETVQVQVLLSAVKSGFLRHFGCLENPVFLCLTSTLTSTPMDEWKYIFVLNVADVFCSVFRCDKIKSRRWKMEKPDIFLFPFSSIALKDKGGSGIG